MFPLHPCPPLSVHMLAKLYCSKRWNPPATVRKTFSPRFFAACKKFIAIALAATPDTDVTALTYMTRVAPFLETDPLMDELCRRRAPALAKMAGVDG